MTEQPGYVARHVMKHVKMKLIVVKQMTIANSVNFAILQLKNVKPFKTIPCVVIVKSVKKGNASEAMLVAGPVAFVKNVKMEHVSPVVRVPNSAWTVSVVLNVSVI